MNNNLKKGVIIINIKKLILFLRFNSLVENHILILTKEEELRKFLIEFGVKNHNGIKIDLTATNKKQISLEYEYGYGRIFITCMKINEIKKKFNYQKFNIMIGINRNFYFKKLNKDVTKINWDFPLAEK